MTKLTKEEIKNRKFWLGLANKNLKGKTIRKVRYLTNEEEKHVWCGDTHRTIIIIFTDGSWILPSIDEEGNGAGAFFTSFNSPANVLV
jgi:hypothetical protein